MLFLSLAQNANIYQAPCQREIFSDQDVPSRNTTPHPRKATPPSQCFKTILLKMRLTNRHS